MPEVGDTTMNKPYQGVGLGDIENSAVDHSTGNQLEYDLKIF